MEPIFVIHYISKVTAGEIIHIGDDVIIYPGQQSFMEVFNWLEKTIVSDHIFVNFLLADLEARPWPMSVYMANVTSCDKTLKA